MNLVNKLLDNANKFADKIAIIEKKKQCTFNQIKEHSLKISKMLQNLGIKKGDYILILQPMSIELYEILFGIWSIGAIAMIFDPSAGKEHIKKCCLRFKPKAFIGTNKAHLLSLYSAEIKQIPIKISTQTSPFMPSIKSSKSLEMADIVELDGDFAALVTFTSGSTGIPKAAVRTHKFLLTQYETLSNNMDYNNNQTDLGTLAVFTLANLAFGITTVIPDSDLTRVSKINARNVVRQILKHKISRITASPSFIKCIVKFCIKDNIKLDGLTHIYTGGGPVFPRLMNEIKDIITNAKLVAVYGSTEAEPIAEINWNDVTDTDLDKMSDGGGLVAGKIISEISCRVIKSHNGKCLGKLTNEEFESITLKNEVGEIVVSGEHVLRGYFEGVGDDENKFDVEDKRWHRTGDLGYFDGRDRLWLMGRANASIEDSYGSVYPFSVECVVNTVFGIDICALLGYKSQRVLVIEGDIKVDIQEIKNKLKWAKLDNIFIIKKIPVDKRHNAKIDYNLLKEVLDKSIKKTI